MRLPQVMYWRTEVRRELTLCVGEGGAASTGESAIDLFANLYNAAAPSSCCLVFVEPRRPSSNSNPVKRQTRYKTFCTKNILTTMDNTSKSKHNKFKKVVTCHFHL